MNVACLDINYDDFVEYTPPPRIMSLERLCAVKVVSENLFNVSESIHIVPGVKRLMMDIAISTANESCIIFLIKHWADKGICFPVPDECMSWKIFFLSELYNESQLETSATCIMENFTQSSTALRYIDLSALPLPDHQIEKLCSIVLAEKTVRNKVNPVIVIYINCSLKRRETFKTLCSALRPGRIKLVVRCLLTDVAFTENELYSLLRILDVHELEQFYCSKPIRSPYANGILAILERFHSLKGLGLIQRMGKYSLKRLLVQLGHLERLSFRGIDARDMLEYCLSGMYQKKCVCPSRCSSLSGGQLKYLSLRFSSYASCSTNLSYLARSPFTETLLHLTLSYSCLEVYSLTMVLQACQKNLRGLELFNCEFSESDLMPLFKAFLCLNKLVCLNFLNRVDIDSMLSAAELLGHLPSLVYIRVGSPYTPYTSARQMRYAKLFEFQFLQNLCESAPSRKICVQFIPLDFE